MGTIQWTLIRSVFAIVLGIVTVKWPDQVLGYIVSIIGIHGILSQNGMGKFTGGYGEELRLIILRSPLCNSRYHIPGNLCIISQG